MLNMDKENLISAIENIKEDSIDRIEWNLEFIDVDLCANRGTKHLGLITAYKLLAKAELKLRGN